MFQMTQILQCLIEDRFCVSGIVRGSQKALRKTKPSEISLELRQIDSDKVLVSKTLPWPTGEELPSKIKYDSKDEVLLIQNLTTLARIPFRSRVLKALEEQHKFDNQPGPRIVSSFDETGQDSLSIEHTKVMTAIRDVIADSSDAKWKKLKKAFSSSKIELSSIFSANEQSKLLDIIKSKITAGDKDAQQILKSLLNAVVFGYKILDEVYLLCESSSFDGVIDDLLHSHQMPLPEKTFAKGLKKAANGSEVEGKDSLRKLMELPFQDKKTAAAASSLLSSSEAAKLIGLLMGMYKDDEEMGRHGKILSLISLLVDSHSTQFLNDPETHESMLEAASFIAAMTALTGTFAELDHTHKARKEVKVGEEEKPEFQIRTIRLEWRNLPGVETKEISKIEVKKNEVKKNEVKRKDVKKKGKVEESDSD